MLKLGTFVVDCTPEVGMPIGFGTGARTQSVRDPLYLRGFIFDDGDTRCVLASLDYAGLMHSAYDELIRALATACGTTADHVCVHCIHQHDTPLPNFEIEPILGVETYPRDWWLDTVATCSKAAAESVAALTPVDAIGHAETRLRGYASNRRIQGADGKVVGVRYSRTADPALRNAPTGTIDPMLRTLSFRADDNRLLGSLSFYATHPQVSNGRRMYSADAPGEAIRLVSQKRNGLHAFFTGAGGNITAGKYSSPTDAEGNLLHFGTLVAAGIERNLATTIMEEPDNLAWRQVSFPFPGDRLDVGQLRNEAEDAETPEARRLLAAVLVTALEWPENASYTVSLLTLGTCRVLLLPGEPFVEYQLHAQSLIPDEFLALAANCSDNFLYLPLAKQLAEGGYEATSFCWCDEHFEARLKQAFTDLLLDPDARIPVFFTMKAMKSVKGSGNCPATV